MQHPRQFSRAFESRAVTVSAPRSGEATLSQLLSGRGWSTGTMQDVQQLGVGAATVSPPRVNRPPRYAMMPVVRTRGCNEVAAHHNCGRGSV